MNKTKAKHNDLIFSSKINTRRRRGMSNLGLLIHLHTATYTGWHSSSWEAQSKGILKDLCPERGRRKQPLKGLSLKGKVWVGASGGGVGGGQQRQSEEES